MPGKTFPIGSIVHELWPEIPGNTVAHLTGSGRLQAPPTQTRELAEFEAPTNIGDRYGARIRGYLHPAVGGAYTFWLASDDESELHLSPDFNPSHKVLIVKTGTVVQRAWSANLGARSNPIDLATGRRYYIEALYKQARKGNHLSVAWDPPGEARAVIPGKCLSPYEPVGGVASETPAALPPTAKPPPAGESGIENLALKARVAASSELSANYVAQGAVDGKIPPVRSRADAGQAWCAGGNVHPQGVTFTFEWPEQVPVAEIVYYGRTAWYWNENWKDYQVRVDDDPNPVVKGQFLQGHGPQRIRIAGGKPRLARKIVLHFTSSHGGHNPGASEIGVYSQSPPDSALGSFTDPAGVQARDVPVTSEPRLDVVTAGAPPPSPVSPANAGPPAPAPSNFYRAINFNGPAFTLDGKRWESSAEAPNCLVFGRPYANPDAALEPLAEGARAHLLKTAVANTGTTAVVLGRVPAGTYRVFLYVWAHGNAVRFSVALNDSFAVTGLTTGKSGQWERLGPWPVGVNKGSLKLVCTGGAVNLCGIEVWRK